MFGAADHLAHGAFGHRLHRAFGVLDVEQVVADAVRLDPPQHREVDIDDVLVAGEHQALFRHVAHGGAAAKIVDDAHADVDLADLQRLRRQRGLDRIRQMIVQARLDLADVLAEAQHDADLVRLDAEEAGHAPQHDRAERDQRKAAAAQLPPGSTLRACPGCGAANPRGQAASVRTIAARSPKAPSTAARSPGPAALIAPWHEISPRRPATCRQSVLLVRVIWEPSAPYNARRRACGNVLAGQVFPIVLKFKPARR